MRAVISCVRPGLLRATKRRGVTPLVTLQNFSGQSSAKSRSTVCFSSSECSCATPLIVWLPTHREIRHAHVARPAFVDEREPREPRVVAGECGAHFVEEAAIDLVDDLEMPRQQRAEEIDGPLLQRLGQQGVIRVGESRARHRPRFFPAERVLIHEQPHQLRDGDRGMRVVELHGPFFMEGRGRAAEQRVDAQHVLQRATREKELLLEPQLLSRRRLRRSG